MSFDLDSDYGNGCDFKKSSQCFQVLVCYVTITEDCRVCSFLQEFTRNFPPGAVEYFANRGRVHIVFQNNFDKISLKSP